MCHFLTMRSGGFLITMSIIISFQEGDWRIADSWHLFVATNVRNDPTAGRSSMGLWNPVRWRNCSYSKMLCENISMVREKWSMVWKDSDDFLRSITGPTSNLLTTRSVIIVMYWWDKYLKKTWKAFLSFPFTPLFFCLLLLTNCFDCPCTVVTQSNNFNILV